MMGGQRDVSKYVPVVLDDGTIVHFEEARSEPSRGGPKQSADVAVQSLGEIAQAATKLNETLKEKLQPDVLTLEIAIGLSAEVGWFFARSTAEGNLKLTLQWKREDVTTTGDATSLRQRPANQ